MNYGNYPDLTQIKKILVIKFRHLGDVLLSTPVFASLKKELPKAEIDAYVYEESKDILEGHPSISEILTYDRKIKKLSFFKRIRKELLLLKQIRMKNYDLIINLTEGDRGAFMAKASKAKYIVGDENGSKMIRKAKIYTHKVKNCSRPRHSVEKDLDFIRKIGIFPKDKSLFFHVPEDSYEKIKALLLKNDISLNKYILIHPASRWRFKCWPTFRVSSFAKELIARGYKLVFSAGNEAFERAMVEEITKDLPKNGFLNLAGQISLKDLGALIDLCLILVCVDSVPLHIASALKAKCISLFGPTDDKKWGPWENENAIVIAKNYLCRPCLLDGCGGSKICECLYSITEEELLSSLEALL